MSDGAEAYLAGHDTGSALLDALHGARDLLDPPIRQLQIALAMCDELGTDSTEQRRRAATMIRQVATALEDAARRIEHPAGA